MNQVFIVLLACLLSAMPAFASSKSSGHPGGSSTHSSTHSSSHASSSHSSSKSSHSSSSPTHSSGGHKSTFAPGVQPDEHGKIKRSEKSKDDFKKQHPCPSTGKSGGSCPGYVIDHVVPLKKGGADAPYNMQWQTEAAAKQKDKWE